MTRRHFDFSCAYDTLFGSLDEAPGTVGLLIVSGGNEVRSGAFGSQAQLAARIAAEGFPVMRYDRCGIGDSGGENLGFRHSRPDIVAACRAFRHFHSDLERLVAFGNCDAASALMLFGGSEADALVLSNPWTFEDDAQDQHSATEVRSRYADKLRNPRELLRLAKGEVSLGKLAKGIRSAVSKPIAVGPLAQAMMQGVAGKPARYLIAGNDRTGLAFVESCGGAGDLDIRRCDKASHAYVEPHARDWLLAQLLDALRG